MSAATASGTRTGQAAGAGHAGQEVGVGRPAGRGALGPRLAARVPTLLRDTGFRRYWYGQTISMFGDQISSIALPLAAVLTLRAAPAQMGVLAALVWLPSLLFGLHAGMLADRFGHWREIGRASCRERV